MVCCNDFRSVWGGGGGGGGVGGGVASNIGAGGGGGGGGGGGLITNILSAAGALSQLRLQTIFDNVKPLQQALGSRRSGPIIVGGLATGVLLYCGHRWLSATGGKQKDRNGWKLKLEAGDDGEDVMLGLETGHFEKLGPKEVNAEPPIGLLEFEEVE